MYIWFYLLFHSWLNSVLEWFFPWWPQVLLSIPESSWEGCWTQEDVQLLAMAWRKNRLYTVSNFCSPPFFFSSGLLVEYGPVLGLWGVVRVGGRKQFLTGLGQFSAIGTYSELSGRPWTGFKSRFIPQDCRTCLKARGQRWDGVRLYHQVSVGTVSLALKHCLRWWNLLPKGRANSHDALRNNW